MKKIIFISFLLAICLLALSACTNGGDQKDPSAPANLRFICDTTTDASVCAKPNTRLLVWTPGGDDGTSGTALQYDLRWSYDQITDANFDDAHQLVREPAPNKSGEEQVVFMPRFHQGEALSYGLMALDEVARKSGKVFTPLVTMDFMEVPMKFYRRCFDQIDNDGDTFIDEADPECGSSLGGSEAIAPASTPAPEFGTKIALIGNIDKDKDDKSDVAVGAPGAINPTSGDDTGSVSVFLALSKKTLVPDDGGLPHIVSWTPPAVVIYGDQSGDRFGAALTSEGDFNGDGVKDLIVGAPGAGKVYIFFGGNGGILHFKGLDKEPDQPAEYYADAVADVIITGSVAESFGTAVELVGNINDHKGHELVVGAPDAYKAYLFYGGLKDSYAIHGYPPQINIDLTVGDWADWTFTGPPGSQFGYSLARIKNLDAKEGDEIAIGAPGLDSVFVFYGGVRSNKAIDFSLVGPQTWNYNGSNYDLLIQGESGSEFGAALASTGSLIGASYGSVVIGAPGVDKVYVLHGSADGIINFPQVGPLLRDVVTQGADWVFEGEAGSRFGEAMSISGDMDGNGYDDLLIGAPNALNGGLAVGAVYAFYTDADNSPDRSYLEADNVIYGTVTGGSFGTSVVGTGSLVKYNHIVKKEYSDVAVGAPGANSAYLEF